MLPIGYLKPALLLPLLLLGGCCCPFVGAATLDATPEELRGTWYRDIACKDCDVDDCSIEITANSFERLDYEEDWRTSIITTTTENQGVDKETESVEASDKYTYQDSKLDSDKSFRWSIDFQGDKIVMEDFMGSKKTYLKEKPHCDEAYTEEKREAGRIREEQRAADAKAYEARMARKKKMPNCVIYEECACDLQDSLNEKLGGSGDALCDGAEEVFKKTTSPRILDSGCKRLMKSLRKELGSGGLYGKMGIYVPSTCMEDD